MRKTIICSISMTEKFEPVVYRSEDHSLPSSDVPVRYPINSFLAMTVKPGDEFKAILLVKKGEFSNWEKNSEYFKSEMNEICSKVGAKVTYVLVESAFVEEQAVYEKQMGLIMDEIEDDTHILVDITYGPKDIPIILFSTLNFAEKFLRCEIDNIIYGKAEFKDGKVVRAQLCDMMPLYCLDGVTGLIECDDSDKARKMLKSLLSL